MSLGTLDNCPRCGTLFVRGVRDVCPKCYQEIEREYEKCSQYLRKRENRGANIQQVSEATGVSIKQITKFIKEGRISIANHPNMGYPCEGCGLLITTGHLCDLCAKELNREISLDNELKERLSAEEQRRRAEKTYRARTEKEN
ncbi:flagellar protein [Brevibacillus sp. SYP-B805]|uniref:TIGR03826 family flagellar region protein n=1 Tax=Brevibacillus sp. SYP-B805 TaxID=1578199 RepID=UPI0013EA30BC|nr:TIGR03826 family flagellar region protein [Brevibacillus sp. SYP-B805]NGQ95626.1 flagellar protein [Brevibacillus sp. SYP-B805]